MVGKMVGMSDADAEADRVLAAVVQGTIHGFATLGISPAELLEVSGLSPEALADPDGWVEYEALVRLWTLVLERFPARPLGLTLARQISEASVGMLGVIGYATHNCRDVRQSIELFIRYSPMAFPRMSMRLEGGGGQARVTFDHEPRVAAMIEPIELMVAHLCGQVRRYHERMPALTEICFRHAPKHAPEVYAEFLGDGVRFEAGWNGFAFDAAALDLPIAGADPRIGKYLQQQAEAQLEAFGEAEADEPLDARVRAIIDQGLMAGRADQASVAQALGMSPRTLQRGLEAQGTSFGQQLEQVRRGRALQLLRLPRLSTGEVAFMLGYANPRSFYRSFRRWTGQTPSEYRRRQ